jgi:alginate O-acetyltransferase complex protein AlgI
MTLGGWFRDYVYIPLGGNRVSAGRWVVNILVVWMLTGLWHGAAWNFVAWGLLFAVLLLLEKWKGFPNILKRMYVLPVVVVSFVIFNAADLAQAWQDLRGMFGGLGIPLVSDEALYYLKSYGTLLLVGSVGATPLVKKWAAPLRPVSALRLAVCIGLLVICTAYLVDGSFNPFLYFRF